MICKFCKKEIDETLKPPEQERKVLSYHWSCFQYQAINGFLHVIDEEGIDWTLTILKKEFKDDEKK